MGYIIIARISTEKWEKSGDCNWVLEFIDNKQNNNCIYMYACMYMSIETLAALTTWLFGSYFYKYHE